MHKLVWIVGASTGIGAETARQMADSGYRVAVSARSEDKLKTLAEVYPDNIFSYPLDISAVEDVAKTFSAIEKDHGDVDMVIMNAATYDPEELSGFTAAGFKHVFDVNVQGYANVLEPVLLKFKDRKAGHIAIVASCAGYRGLPRSLSYGPSKAALINIAEGLYMECKPLGIKVQVINPGFVRTPLTDKNDFDMPFLMEVGDAAKALIKGL